MAQHRKSRSHGRRLGIVVLAALGMALSGALVGPPVDAAVTLKPKQKIVKLTSADVTATCKFQATKATPTSVSYTLSASARPAGLYGYRDNVFTHVDCYVLPPGETDPVNAFIEFHPSTFRATLARKNAKGVVPYFTSYTLCGVAHVELKSGGTTSTPYVCG